MSPPKKPTLKRAVIPQEMLMTAANCPIMGTEV
jgi:hypothetical protein